MAALRDACGHRRRRAVPRERHRAAAHAAPALAPAARADVHGDDRDQFLGAAVPAAHRHFIHLLLGAADDRGCERDAPSREAGRGQVARHPRRLRRGADHRLARRRPVPPGDARLRGERDAVCSVHDDDAPARRLRFARDHPVPARGRRRDRSRALRARRLAVAARLAAMDGGLPHGRAWRRRALPSRARAPLCSRVSDRALPLPAGGVHGALRLPRVRRRAGGHGLARSADRERHRPRFVLERKKGVTETVAIPFWLALAAGLFALWALYEHVLMPALRWMLMHPANRVIDEVSERLRIGIRPFQRTRRQALIHRLLTDPKVQEAADQYARTNRTELGLVFKKIEMYAREIVPAFNAYLYFRIGYWLGRRIARLLYRVRIGYVDSAGIERIDPHATVVCVMNHRSNMDYVLAGFLAADQAALSYAVGEWARIWPLSALIRAMGAYFVRRNSRDELYRRVLERYIAMATEAGVPQAVFPEGGLTRDGRMREPKMGAIDYTMRGFRLDGDRDLVFVPLGINYDRVLEDRSLLRSLEAETPRVGRARALGTTFRFFLHNLWLALRSEWHRFGYACVNFGSPVSMREYCRERNVDFHRLSGDQRRHAMALLGNHLMDAVGKIVPVLPVPLIATVF